jgi:histidyl-tRNA synthetase
MARFRYIEEAFRSCCLGWGYKEIRTPTLEYLHLFTSTGTLTPSMLNKVYSFLDWDGWSGERVVLRPEGTIPAARLYIGNLPQSCPAKLFYVENIFSFEETGKESRERWQCGAELIGSGKPAADVELMLLALETLGGLGIKGVELYLSHAGLIKALLAGLGLTPAEQSQIFDRILDGDKEVVGKIISAKPQLGDSLSLLFELRGKSSGFLKNLKASLMTISPDLEPSIDDFIAIAQLLTTMGKKYQIDITSGKGFEYYTGIIFQFYFAGRKIGGGGRYNDLIPLLGGGDVPASGCALYVDQLMDLISLKEDKAQMVLVRSEIDTDNGAKLSFEAARLLREAGYVAELDRGYKGLTEHRWLLRIQGKKGEPPLLLTDQVSGKSVGANSVTEIIGILKATNASEASPS